MFAWEKVMVVCWSIESHVGTAGYMYILISSWQKYLQEHILHIISMWYDFRKGEMVAVLWLCGVSILLVCCQHHYSRLLLTVHLLIHVGYFRRFNVNDVIRLLEEEGHFNSAVFHINPPSYWRNHWRRQRRWRVRCQYTQLDRKWTSLWCRSFDSKTWWSIDGCQWYCYGWWVCVPSGRRFDLSILCINACDDRQTDTSVQLLTTFIHLTLLHN